MMNPEVWDKLSGKKCPLPTYFYFSFQKMLMFHVGSVGTRSAFSYSLSSHRGLCFWLYSDHNLQHLHPNPFMQRHPLEY